MNIRISKLAQLEIDEAVAWFDSQSQGLGTRFLDDIDRTVRRIVAFPLSCAEIETEIRRCLFTRFPYGIIYGVDNDTIVVIAVAHLHREPRYWMDRLSDVN
ncbi:MAG: type II toxin-antitoxin system RelE/ParE family toxin [Deltaproteobacteria bacterium]|nr:type II toxin-antitoxin system RelE/ParE family toxin [Deltaproteobacteria bacterium]